ncbi:hypothetical protein B0H11DRAFT_1904009 [Mycena galericulata]|nr:hypothetical protein B0H11DRAFT_1904009 [Mycena galericulata]
MAPIQINVDEEDAKILYKLLSERKKASGSTLAVIESPTSAALSRVHRSLAKAPTLLGACQPRSCYLCRAAPQTPPRRTGTPDFHPASAYARSPLGGPPLTFNLLASPSPPPAAGGSSIPLAPPFELGSRPDSPSPLGRSLELRNSLHSGAHPLSPHTPSPHRQIPSLLSPLVTDLRTPTSRAHSPPEEDMVLSPLSSSPLSPSPSGGPPSPSSTLVGSEGSVSPEKHSSQRKRQREPALFDTLDLRRSKRHCGTTSTTALEDVAAAALSSMLAQAHAAPDGDGDDGSDGGDLEDDEYNAEARRGGRGRGRARARGKRPCRGNGDRERRTPVAAAPPARSVGQIREALQREEGSMEIDGEDVEGRAGGTGTSSSQMQTRGNGKGKEVEWLTDGKPPEITELVARPLVKLSLTSTSSDKQNQLLSLLLSYNPNDGASTSSEPVADGASSQPLPFTSLANRCDRQETLAVGQDFEQMLGYMELALHIQWLKKSPQIQTVTMRTLADMCDNPAINEARLQKWLGYGSRLLYLAAAVIEGIAFALRQPPAPGTTLILGQELGDVIRHLIVPQMALVKQWASNLDSSHFRLLFPPELNVLGSQQTYIPFKHLSEIQKRLDAFDFNYYAVAPADPVWKIMASEIASLPIPKPGQMQRTVESNCIGEEILIDTPLDLKNTPCPVTAETTTEWTAMERRKAAEAIEMTSIGELRTKLLTFHKGGVKTSDVYLLIDSGICDGKILHIRGADNKFLCLLATNLTDHLPHNNMFLSQVSSVMFGEVFKDLSNRLDFSYLAWHCSMYARYGEKGLGAPKDVHPHFIRKKGKARVNHGQRVPRPSKEMQDRPEEAELLSELIQLITTIVEHHVRSFCSFTHSCC